MSVFLDSGKLGKTVIIGVYMFYSSEQINESIRAIVNDDYDNDIVFVTAHRGVGKTELLREVYKNCASSEIIVADGKTVHSCSSSLVRGFVEGIICFLRKYNTNKNRKIICDSIRNQCSRVELRRASRSLAYLLNLCPEKICRLQLNELKNIYFSIAQRTPLVIISSAMTLSSQEIDYLRNLQSDTLGARVTYIIGIRAVPSNHEIVSNILEVKSKGVYILPLSANIVKESIINNPHSLASMELRTDDDEVLRVDDETILENSFNIDVYDIISDLVKKDLNPQILPVLANQDVSTSSYEYVKRITDEIYQEKQNKIGKELVLQNDGRMLWLDVLSYYLFMEKGLDKAIEATQVFFNKVIDLMTSTDENRKVVFDKRIRKSFPAFIHEVSERKNTNNIARGFKQYYSDFATLAKIVYLRETNNDDLPVASQSAISVLERVASDFSVDNIAIIEHLYESAQICSVLDIGLEIITDYVKLLEKSKDIKQFDHVYKGVHHFVNICIKETIKWNDLTLLEATLNLLYSLRHIGISILTESDMRVINENPFVKRAALESFVSNSIDSKELVKIKTIEDSLIAYWNEMGKSVLSDYKKSNFPHMPEKSFLPEKLDDMLSECESIIMTASSLEDRIVTNGLVEKCGGYTHITADSTSFDFFAYRGHKIVHVAPLRISSFTKKGSAEAIRCTLKHIKDRRKIRGVFGIGIAYGSDHIGQRFGDVLISERVISWTEYFKYSDGEIKLNPDNSYTIGEEILAGANRYLSITDYPINELGFSFRWYLGSTLCGPAVLSDEDFKNALIDASEKIGIKDIIGGEMEGSGIEYEIRNEDKTIPMMIVKGICDWGAKKNGWKIIEKDPKKQNEIKDSIQAYACKNALAVYFFILENAIGGLE